MAGRGRLSKFPVYMEARPDWPFTRMVNRWLMDRDMNPEILLISRPNLIASVLRDGNKSAFICFYTKKLSPAGMVVYYDLEALPATHKIKIENTFTNWIAHKVL